MIRECAYGEGELASHKGNFVASRGSSGVAAEVLAGRNPLGYFYGRRCQDTPMRILMSVDFDIGRLPVVSPDVPAG